jgi:hypothetical protein
VVYQPLVSATNIYFDLVLFLSIVQGSKYNWFLAFAYLYPKNSPLHK